MAELPSSYLRSSDTNGTPTRAPSADHVALRKTTVIAEGPRNATGKTWAVQASSV